MVLDAERHPERRNHRNADASKVDCLDLHRVRRQPAVTRDRFAPVSVVEGAANRHPNGFAPRIRLTGIVLPEADDVVGDRDEKRFCARGRERRGKPSRAGGDDDRSGLTTGSGGGWSAAFDCRGDASSQ